MSTDTQAAISGQAARAVVQSRDLTSDEARRLGFAPTKQVAKITLRDGLYWVGRILVIAAIIGWLISFSALSDSAGNPARIVMPWSILAMVIGATLMFRRQFAPIAASVAAQFRAGTRFELRDDGLRVQMTDMDTVYGWHGITALVPNGPFLYVHIGSVYVTAVTCSAITNQDVDGFCAELEQRWRAARSQST